jgi:3-oxoacyl-[acyl-carrier protein] reductase
MKIDLSRKTALITGANHGIGAEIARTLAACGARVAIHFLDLDASPQPDITYTPLHVNRGRPAAEALAAEIAACEGEAMLVSGDLLNAATIPALFKSVEAAWGPVNILVNNAANCEDPDTIFTLTAGTFDRTFGVNARASLLLMAEFVRRFQALKGTYGRMISISTDAAQAFSGQITYGSSKAAIEAFTRAVAIEVGPLGITVNVVAPGPIQTGWMTPAMVARIEPGIPLGRVGYPADIASTVAFLASEQAAWLTGQVIKVSGGHNL